MTDTQFERLLDVLDGIRTALVGRPIAVQPARPAAPPAAVMSDTHVCKHPPQKRQSMTGFGPSASRFFCVACGETVTEKE